jgi:hypothetical protein
MKLELNGEEISVVMMSLIRRRTSVQELSKLVCTADSVAGYARELEVVESLIEKLNPGSLDTIRNIMDKAA